MHSRTPDSTTPSLASLPSKEPLESPDCWVWFVTERGLRASGAASMKAAAKRLRQTAAELDRSAQRLNQEMAAPANGSDSDDGATPPRVLRPGTVCGRYRNEHRAPDLRLSGKWLQQAGFELGRKCQVQVGAGRLTICDE